MSHRNPPDGPGPKRRSVDVNSSSPVVIVLDDDDHPGITSQNKPEEAPVSAVIDLVGQVPVGDRKCINYLCKSGLNLSTPPIFCMSYYRVKNDSNKNQKICRECYDTAVEHYDQLYTALTEGGDIMDVDLPMRDETFAIEDSDSDDEVIEPEVFIDESTMQMLEEHFDDVLNSACQKVNYEEKINDAIEHLKIKHESNSDSLLEVKTMLESIRKEVDSMLMGLYNNPKYRVQNTCLPELIIPEPSTSNIPVLRTPPQKFIPEDRQQGVRNTPARNVALPGIMEGSSEVKKAEVVSSSDAILEPPPDLPVRGRLLKPPLMIGNIYFAKRNSPHTAWSRVLLETIHNPGDILNGVELQTRMVQVSRLERCQKPNTSQKLTLNLKKLAYSHPPPVLLEVGTRVIALFKEFEDLKLTRRDYYPGVVGESPTQYNRYRYLIFFDDGYAHYVHYNNVFLIYESSKDVWEDVSPDSRTFIKKYVTEYPNRSMVKLLKNQTVRTEYRGKWYVTTVMNVDCSLVQMFFDSLSRVEWIYRGSRRLNTMYKEEQAASSRLHNRQRNPRAAVTTSTGRAPYVQYIRDDPDVIFVANDEEDKVGQQRSVAKKSTRTPLAVSMQQLAPNKVVNKAPLKPEVGPPGKIVYYTPRKQNPSSKIYKPHNCSDACQKEMHTTLQRLKGYGPLAKPLLCGFYRLHYKVSKSKKPFVMYKTPCGKTVRNMEELHYYLRVTKSQLTVDLFNFDYWIRCLAEFILEPNLPIVKDLSSGIEEIQIPVVNYVDNELNDFVNYSTKRMPMEGVNLNLDPEFLVGCDCEDDCSDKKKCSCWQLTLQGIKYLNKDEKDVGYSYRRLKEPIFTGIYECNSRCKCAKTCLNRVVQNPLQHKLQVFKTVNRGWGIRCINDIPQGSFICIYAGALLTDQMANEGGKNFGDEYLAELDYIESVEHSKEDYEEEAYHSDQENTAESTAEDEEEETNETERAKRKPKEITQDEDYRASTGEVSLENATNIRTRLRKRRSDVKKDAEEKVADNDSKKENDVKKIAEADVKKIAEKKTLEDEDTVMISDDEEVREPSSFNPAENDDLDETVRKYRSVRDMYGSDESVYIMDAKNTGNIGRYLNHSCSPNVFVQNVFVDTHDLRFPWVSFFTNNFIRAGTELTWNYNYDVGSVQGKVLECRCGSAECKGRLL